MLIAGESDVGKTQLAVEIAYEAYNDGATVLHGRCDNEVQVRFQPFETVLRQSIADADAVGALPTLGPLGGELVRLVPEVTSLLPDLAPPVNADPETEQYRLFDAVSQWLQALAQVSPVVCVIDDLQWATRPTLQLLRHVFRSTPSARLLLLGTYRDTDLGSDHPLTELLTDLPRVPGLDREVLTKLPESVRDVAALRLARLSEATRATLDVAAVIGAEFDFDVLVAAGRLDDDAVLTALDEAVAARLVLEFAPLKYRFAHNIVRETILDGLTDARRSRAHHRVAEAIALLDTRGSRLRKT